MRVVTVGCDGKHAEGKTASSYWFLTSSSYLLARAMWVGRPCPTKPDSLRAGLFFGQIPGLGNFETIISFVGDRNSGGVEQFSWKQS